MTDWRCLVEKDYLGAWDMTGPDGKTPRDYTLRIEAVTSVALKTKQAPKGKRKCVIRFVGARKGFVANSTNCQTIESMYGRHFEEWIGKCVTLYQGDVKNPNGRGTVKGILVRPMRPKGEAEAITEKAVDPDIRAAQNEAFQSDADEGPGT